jgi:pimeloyl-ACP methyl ester carboxylesterase
MSISQTLRLILITSLLSNCNSDTETGGPVAESSIRKYLVTATPGEEMSHTLLQLMASGFGQSQVAERLKYDVKTYRLTYTTLYKGEFVNASGLMMVPVGIQEPAPMVSLQHGTTFEKDEAPSERGGFHGMEFFASAGYITLMPDFLGYGESAHLFHPYYDREHSALTVIDLIKAAKEFMISQNLTVGNKLFLAGYSEGGYVTLAAAQEMERNPIEGLTLSGVAAGAGGYDLPEMLSSITQGTYYAYPSYLAFVLMSYNKTLGWNKPLSYFFKAKYADALAKYLNGDYSGSYINARLTTHVPSLFDDGFLKGLRTPDAERDLKDALAENSVAGWRTDVPRCENSRRPAAKMWNSY